MVRPWIAALAGAAAGVLVGTIAAGIALEETTNSGAPPTHFHRTVSDDPPIKTLRIDPIDDEGKPGTVHGVMGWRYFEVPVNSVQESEHQLRFRFLAAAEILQIDVSVDINDPRADLVEFAAGINMPSYAFDRSGDTVMHVSWSESGSSQVDETVQLPAGTEVGPGDFVGVAAYMGGFGEGDAVRVSPEVVVLYRWL